MRASAQPATIQRAATSQPNVPPIKMMPVSLMSGDAIRNVRVIDSGTPAATSPMNSGTELQEQNGVMVPRTTASTSPVARRRPRRNSRIRSGEIAVLTSPTANSNPMSSSVILVVS